MSNKKVQQNSSPIKGLKESFAKQKIAFTNRASAVFPLYLREDTDLHIVFLNYWTIKNNIPMDMLSINIKIYDVTFDIFLINYKSINI